MVHILFKGEAPKLKCDMCPDQEPEEFDGVIGPGPCKPFSAAFRFPFWPGPAGNQPGRTSSSRPLDIG